MTAEPRPCQRKGCDQHADGALVIMLPYNVEVSKLEASQRISFRQPDPMAFFVGVELCEAHVRAFDATGFLSNSVRMEMARRTVGADRGRPDFDRAYPKSVPLDDPHWLEFKKGIAAAQAANPDPVQ